MKQQSPKNIGAYTYYDFCRFCFGKNVTNILDLGLMPLAGGFLPSLTRKNLAKEKYYPLQLLFCLDCFLVQTTTVIASDTLFKNYFYFSSKIGTLVAHFKNIADAIPTLLAQKKKPFIVEIGCNDGSFLTAVQKKGYKVLGIDPATNVVMPLVKKGLPIINDYFTKAIALAIKKKHGLADAIYSFNTLAHIENMHDVFSGIEHLLKNDGYVIFETHYLGNLLEQVQYDMIYHEHQYYYSLLTIQKVLATHNLQVFNVELIPNHAGSIRFYVQKDIGKRPIHTRVAALMKKEKEKKYDTISSYRKFARNIETTKKDLLETITILKKKKKIIAGYGASGRGTIVMNYCNLTTTHLDYVVDDAPAKQHVFIPGVHIPTQSSAILSSHKRPDYVLLFAWSFLSEVQKKHAGFLKNGGRFIVPLPKIKIIQTP